ncbi:MAG: D-sedoheptulose 7-phosphate isomerase [Campylobacteraceae bacterium]|jgi:D-sedoheptulose 7-phosphate isomerase|nr:D-sedoheptulose 7-phosphate isomerase [Campylobacteraceae bacterium]
MMEMIRSEINSHIQTARQTFESLQNYIYTACVIATDTISKGNKILIFGNGGSAADAQHIAAELVGRYKTNRKGLSAIALTTDTSALTAIGNDFGYESVFERQVEALAREGDLLIGISTSGTSLNVVRALKLGREIGCRCVGFSGKNGGVMDEVCDINIIIPSSDTPRIQEMHIMIGHIICQAIDSTNS